MNEHEHNYLTHDLELEAVIHVLKMWMHYLLGKRFVLMSDHSGLRYMFDQLNLNSRQARWLAMISEFDFQIRLQKGTCDQDVDYHLTTDGLMRFRDKIYVPDNSELKNLILREFHTKSYSGHPRYQKTSTIVKKFYYWPNLKKGMVEFVAICLDCQQVKVECKHPGGILQLIVILAWKWEVISMNFIIGLPRTSRNNDSIIVVVERLTKVTHFIPVKSTYSASDAT
eukprot:PITA_35105